MDTVREITRLLKGGFPTLPYFYDGDDGLWHFVYLGGNKCGSAELIPYSYLHKHLFFTLCGLYEHRPLSDDGTVLAARTFKKLMSSCGFRLAGIYTLGEQENYLQSLSGSELRQIAGQVEMYRSFREAYTEYYRKSHHSSETTE